MYDECFLETTVLVFTHQTNPNSLIPINNAFAARLGLPGLSGSAGSYSIADDARIDRSYEIKRTAWEWESINTQRVKDRFRQKDGRFITDRWLLSKK